MFWIFFFTLFSYIYWDFRSKINLPFFCSWQYVFLNSKYKSVFLHYACDPRALNWQQFTPDKTCDGTIVRTNQGIKINKKNLIPIEGLVVLGHQLGSFFPVFSATVVVVLRTHKSVTVENTLGRCLKKKKNRKPKK